ncbi:MAG: MBL fold metallo-hydrolase [Acidobacteria bacterium]|nr:MBL fold metallo-hydrolase [Acidobacteriota bacterium]
MILDSAAVAPFFKNGFVVGCEVTREAVFIDPGDEVDELLAFIAAEQLKVQAILLTHAHVDHVSGVGRAKRALAAPIHLHRDDLFLYDQAAAHGRLFGLDVEQPPPVDVYYDGQGPVAFGEYDVLIHHTPGHCPGGVCLQVGRRGEAANDLFVGDTLFAGSIGRTDLPGGDHEILLHSITQVLFSFSDDARVYSGHGPATTIGQERQTNPFVLDWQRRR